MVTWQRPAGYGYFCLNFSIIILTTSSKSAFASQILFLLAGALAKASTLYLMMRLFNLSGPKSQSQTRSRSLYIVAVAILAIVGLWALLSIVAVSVNCSTSDFILADQSQCSHQVRVITQGVCDQC